VVETFLTKVLLGDAGYCMRQLIGIQDRIRDYIGGNDEAILANDAEFTVFRATLSEMLSPRNAPWLCGMARSIWRGRQPDLIVTSTISWIVDKSQFAWDTSRTTFLAPEETHFIRKVLSDVPTAKIIEDGASQLIPLTATAERRRRTFDYGRDQVDQPRLRAAGARTANREAPAGRGFPENGAYDSIYADRYASAKSASDANAGACV
jgi:hypothetical protein